MNRIHSAAKLPHEVLESTLLGVDPHPSSTLLNDTSYALFAPLHYEPGYAYPLIVWLHGPGEDERQLTRIMPEVSLRNYVAIAPRAPRVFSPDRPGLHGHQWQQTPSQIQKAEASVFGSVELASRKFHIAPKRIFLAGFDCGGTMAFRVAMNHPEPFAGVLSVCGRFPTGLHPFGHLNQARRLSVFLAAGRRSRRYTSKDVCADLRLLHSAGISITLRQYPSRHELSTQVLRDMDRWIIEQITCEVEATADVDKSL